MTTQEIAICVFLYAIVAVLPTIASITSMLDEKEDEDTRKYYARALLATFIWPIAYPIVFFVWVLKTAFPRKEKK